jgi:hypothetical protein
MKDYTNYRLNVRGLLAALLLAVYATGAIGIDLFHHSLHDHSDKALHTEEAEKDPCHLSIYHLDKEDGCDHKTHLTKAEKCKYSHVVFQSNQLLVHPTTTKPSFADCFTPSFYHFCVEETSSLTLSLRGPPVM